MGSALVEMIMIDFWCWFPLVNQNKHLALASGCQVGSMSENSSCVAYTAKKGVVGEALVLSRRHVVPSSGHYPLPPYF